jgi:hypothetical protein
MAVAGISEMADGVGYHRRLHAGECLSGSARDIGFALLVYNDRQHVRIWRIDFYGCAEIDNHSNGISPIQ